MEPKEGNVSEMPSSGNTSTKLRRIAELAKEAPDMCFTSLSHHIDHEFLQEAYHRTRKDGAPGVDRMTALEYEQDLDGNLDRLLTAAKTGSYRAPPVRRVQIPKGEGKEYRPIGIPTFEDKVLQQAVKMVLESVYEQDFRTFSYGFRPGRSAHQALSALWSGIMGMYGGWVVEVDIRRFFDTVDHQHLREILSQRVRDGVITRLIGKWLNAGVLESGEVHYPDQGTPQGGVISPMLANIYLNEVVDRWWEEMIQPRLKGQGVLIRYADDMVMVFENKTDADRMMEALPKRFERYGLKLHPEKTRKLPFESPDKWRRPPENGPHQPPGSFDFLGFTHYWGKSKKRKPVVKVKTAATRLRRTLVRLNQWLRTNRHQPVWWQHKKLSQSLSGHYGYFGLTGNGRSLEQLRHQVERLWKKWLGRRSWKARMTWSRFALLKQRYPLPPVKIVHSVFLGANP
jgi:group II intron reverse transcriptase/maturase